MKLITKALENLFNKYTLYSQEGKGSNAVVLAKYFMPGSAWTWYVTEAEKQADGDYLFFGYVDGLDGEFGYFTLSQLSELRGRFGLKVERDLYFNSGKTTLANEIRELATA